jgi:hypothetical protein
MSQKSAVCWKNIVSSPEAFFLAWKETLDNTWTYNKT